MQDAETIKVIGNIMKTNVAACSSIGSYFYPQLGRIYMDMLQMYRATSQMISEAVQREGRSRFHMSLVTTLKPPIGDIATKMPKVRGLRTIKKEILKLIDNYVDKADDLELVNNNIVPPLLEAVLVDYNRNVPDARDAEVLNVMTTIISKLHVRWTPYRSKYSVRETDTHLPKSTTNKSQNLMEDKVQIIMENVFECTLAMINKDFSEYPQHRVEFFKLLKAINVCCFPALLKLDQREFKLVIDSCLWASKHDNREVEGTGLTMCNELIDNMAATDPQTSSMFFRQFFLTILQDVFFVLTDTDHKAGAYTSVPLRLMVLIPVQDSKHNRCYLRACSTSSRRERSPSPSTPLNKRSKAPRIRTSCGSLLATSFRMHFPTFRRKFRLSKSCNSN